MSKHSRKISHHAQVKAISQDLQHFFGRFGRAMLALALVMLMIPVTNSLSYATDEEQQNDASLEAAGETGTDPAPSNDNSGTDPVASNDNSDSSGTDPAASENKTGTDPAASDKTGTDPKASEDKTGTDPNKSDSKSGTDPKASDDKAGTDPKASENKSGTDPAASDSAAAAAAAAAAGSLEAASIKTQGVTNISGPERTNGTERNGKVYSKDPVVYTVTATVDNDTAPTETISAPNGDFSGWTGSDSTWTATITYNTTATDTITIGSQSTSVDVVIDNAGPTVNSTNYSLTSSDTASLGSDTVSYFDLNSSSPTLTVTASVTDEIFDSSTDNSYLKVEWLDASGAATGSTENKTASWTASSDTYTADFSFGASDFVSNDSLRIAKATVVAKDILGNETESTSIYFSAENALLKDDSLTFALAPNTDVKSYTDTSGNQFFNGDVTCTVTDASSGVISQANTDTTVTLDGTNQSLSWSSNAADIAVAADANAEKAHTVSVTAKTTHGATREYTKSFTTDTTTPTANVSLSAPKKTESGVNYYSIDKPAVLTVALANTFSLRSTSDIVVTLNDGSSDVEIPSTAISWSDYTATIQNSGTTRVFDEQKTYTVKSVTYKTKFDSSDDDPTAFSFTSPGSFLIDSINPQVTLNFSGPVVTKEIQDKIMAFFGKKTDETTYNVGSVTVTITDAALDLSTVGVYVDGTQIAADSTTWSSWTEEKAEISIPYYVTETGELMIGEGKHDLVVKAQDMVGNYAGGSADGYKYSTKYSQGGKDSTTSVNGVTDNLADKFTVDVTPVVLTSDLTLPSTSVPNGDTLIYDGSSASLKVTATDPNFDKDSSKLEIYSEKGTLIDTLSGDAWGEPDSSNTYTINYTFAEGNGYSFKIYGNDLAGNMTQEYDSKAELGYYFSLDSKPPTVSATLDSEIAQTVSSTDYFSADPVRVTVTAQDPNFDKTNSVITYIDASGTTQTIAPGDGWKGGNGTYTYDLVLEGQNAYSVIRSFTVKATDLLSHAAADYTYANMRSSAATGFVIDTEVPSLDVKYDRSSVGSLTEDGTTIAYYDAAKVRATITATDLNFDSSSSSITYSGGSLVQNWTQSTSDPKVWTAIVEFNENAVNTTSNLKVEAKDYAKKAAAPYDSGLFVLDATAPKVDVSFTASPVGSFESVDYYDTKPTATITVTDNNFEPSLDWSGISQVGSNTKLEWVQGDSANVWKATIEFAENRVDTDAWRSALSTFATDKVYRASNRASGNHGTSWNYSDDHAGIGEFVVDLTTPTVSVYLDQPINSSFDGKDFFGSAETLTATVTVVDNNFDTALSPVTDMSTTGTWAGSWQTGDNYTYTTTITYSENSGNVSTLVLDLIADKVYSAANSKSAVAQSHATSYAYGAANTQCANETTPAGTSFVLDLTAPTLTAAKESTGYSTRWGSESDPYLFYSTDGAGITVTMEDINGIRFAAAESPFALSGRGSDLGTVDTQIVALIEGSSVGERDSNNDQMRRALVKLTDYAGNYSIWNISPDGTVSRVAYGSTSRNNSSIDVRDGSSVHPLYMVLDRVAPYLSWGSAPTPGAYYNSAQSAVININELNFDLLQYLDGGRVIATVSKQEGNAGRASSSWTVPASAFAGGGNDWSSRIDFTTEGHYSVFAQFDDIAGNTSNAISLGEFTLDWTAPVIQDITFDNNDARNGKYYKAGRTATITIIEHNWDPSLVTITTNGSVSGWSDNGDTHTCTVSFLTDGDYNLSVGCTDKAGNAAESKSVPEFTVDLTKPTITFTDVAASTAYNGTIAPVINYADEKNFDPNGMQYTLTGAKHGAQSFSASQGSSGNQGNVTFSDFPRQVEADDIYTLTAHLTDLAGNEADGSIMFSVNRFGSNFMIVDADDYADGYLANPQEILVQEINVSGVQSESHGVTVTHALNTENLSLNGYGTPSSEGYYIASGSDGSGWSSYLYHIGSGNFKDDGNYHVVISSTDTANNLNNSASYYDPDKHAVSDAEVSFILDTADPIIDGLNVSNGGLYDTNNTKVTFNVIDNIGCKEVQVNVDDETYSSKDSDIVKLEANGYCTVNLPAKAFAPRHMKITAKDYANRSVEAEVKDFRMTDNFFELNMVLIIGGLVVVAAAVAGGIVFMRRRNQAPNDVQE